MEASTNQVAEQQMPVYNIPSKILCRVVNVNLKVIENLLLDFVIAVLCMHFGMMTEEVMG